MNRRISEYLDHIVAEIVEASFQYNLSHEEYKVALMKLREILGRAT